LAFSGLFLFFWVFGLWGAPVALLVFGFGSGLFLTAVWDDLLWWAIVFRVVHMIDNVLDSSAG